MQVYLACTVRGARGGIAAGRVICERLLQHGHDVLTTHLLADDVEHAESSLTEVAVYRRDVEWLDACDVLGRAAVSGQRVVLLYDAARREAISRLVIGNDHPHCTLFCYESLSELSAFIDQQYAPSAESPP